MFFRFIITNSNFRFRLPGELGYDYSPRSKAKSSVFSPHSNCLRITFI